MPDYANQGYAFPPRQIPTYFSLTQFVKECNDGLPKTAHINRKSAEGIALSGIFDQLTKVDGCVTIDSKDRLQIAPEAVKALQSIKKIDLEKFHQKHGDQEILNVRVRPARTVPLTDDGEREYLGWHAKLTPEQQRLGVTRWWSRPYRDDIEGMPFIATITGFVVYAGIIKGIERESLGLVSFDVCVDTADETYGEKVKDIREDLLFTRVDSPRGGNIAYI